MTDKTAVVQAEAVPAETNVVPISETAALMEVISKAASDPNVDVGKMERLFAMHERITERNAKVEFNTALAELQPKLPIIDENGSIVVGKKVQSRYAYLEDIVEATRELLREHGFSASFRTGRDDGAITVTCILSHSAGHSEDTTIHLPADNSGSKNTVQAVASSITYGKRYTLVSLLNITSKGDDDDGVAAGDGKPETAQDWQGPLGKTELRGEFNKFDKLLQNACDMTAVENAWGSYRPVLDQLQADMPQIWNGWGDVPSVMQRLKAAKWRARLVTACRNEFAESTTLDQLQYHFKERQQAISELPSLQKKAAVQAKDDRKAELEKERNLA